MTNQLTTRDELTDVLYSTPDGGELVEDAVISILETTAKDSKKYKTQYYNLDAISGKTAAETIHRKTHE